MLKNERFNSISHLIGTIWAVSGTALLIVLAAFKGDVMKIVSFSIYGASLILLYLSSTLYHSLRGKARDFFQKMDHSAIYLLIAGTYTPFTLVAMHGARGWFYFGVVWFLAAVGIISDNFFPGKRRILPVVLYLVMGWLAVTAVRPLIGSLSQAGFSWLLAGGLLYSGGVVFYGLGKRMEYSHEIWHLFVLGGSACQFITILFYVL